ncbi:D-site 20S pre-rRNA nuclease [Hypoxylon sp. FL1284]|nr:D-site 20S pre-rRNA nuclease [Hypoxylon sp. FL1284]
MEATEPQQAVGASQSANVSPDSKTTPPKPIHSLVVDTGPLIKNEPPVSTLLAQAHELYTLPSVISEIRDAATKSRVETTLLPFLKLRNPKPESVKFVTDFARRTGDLEVLSRPDLHLIALTYELECERNGGDWRLRSTPAQKGLNGKPPAREKQDGDEETTTEQTVDDQAGAEDEQNQEETNISEDIPEAEQGAQEQPTIQQETVTQALDNLSLEPSALPTADTAPDDAATASTKAYEEEADDDEGWITPTNLKKHQAKDQLSAPEQPIQKLLQAALLTSDFAMQNVALRINLNLVSAGLARITRVKTWVLRCHGCFQVTRDTARQFCPRCGQPTLTRASATTDAAGQARVHLKKNFQWNNRGNVYSVPKPVHGSASGKKNKSSGGGGKNGWGRDLVLAEDQKEYVRKTADQRRARQRDLMDEDYLPGILTGDRSGGAPGRIRVGAGRNVNSRKR